MFLGAEETLDAEPVDPHQFHHRVARLHPFAFVAAKARPPRRPKGRRSGGDPRSLRRLLFGRAHVHLQAGDFKIFLGLLDRKFELLLFQPLLVDHFVGNRAGESSLAFSDRSSFGAGAFEGRVRVAHVDVVVGLLLRHRKLERGDVELRCGMASSIWASRSPAVTCCPSCTRIFSRTPASCAGTSACRRPRAGSSVIFSRFRRGQRRRPKSQRNTDQNPGTQRMAKTFLNGLITYHFAWRRLLQFMQLHNCFCREALEKLEQDSGLDERPSRRAAACSPGSRGRS